MRVRPPEHAHLTDLAPPVTDGALDVEEVRIVGGEVAGRHVRIRESELLGVTFAPGSASVLHLRDVTLHDCDLSNLQVRDAAIQRVEIAQSRLTGFGITGDASHLRITDSTLVLGSFGASRLRAVVFDQVDLREASFVRADLSFVTFTDCRLEGADFRDARLTKCAIRGTSLDGVLGIASMRGLEMPYPDLLASAGALGFALGITAEEDHGTSAG